ncbi:SIS domain-containing protein [candidate division KSB1 bacterium]|nr:SIS domain-containing protein [candidate division KSB1 bacterium]
MGNREHNDEIRQMIHGFIGEHPEVIEVLVDFAGKYPALKKQIPDILKVYIKLIECFEKGHILYLCGNGGSIADCMHLSAELLKSFEKKRWLTPTDRSAFDGLPFSDELSSNLEYGFPVMVLGLNHSLLTAVENDNPVRSMEYAQELYALGRKGDVLIGISTSGNAHNVNYALVTAKAKGLTTIGFTGKTGGELSSIADIAIKAPASAVNEVQEMHLPIYHTISAMIESHFFKESR